MRTSILASMMLGCAAFLFGMPAQLARADNVSFSLSREGEGGDVCWGWGDNAEGAVGAFFHSSNPACAGKPIIMPLYWQNFYWYWIGRTVRVRGVLGDENSELSCTLYVVGADGFLDSQDSGSFTTVGEYSWLDLTVYSVGPTDSSFISCTSSGGGARLMNVSYSP